MSDLRCIGMWWIIMSVAATVGSVSGTFRSDEVLLCEEAHMRCAMRTGCGSVLNNYWIGCSAVLQGSDLSYCPEICKHSLIALTSTEEGKRLMTCQCKDEQCEEAKRQVEICRPSVVAANRNNSIVSCRVAQWICSADAECSTAMEYYNRYCRPMFQGRKCTHRCLNSISILLRQEKAAKLKTCKCDGHEDYDCPQIQSNMARLCFHKKIIHEETTESAGDIETNIIRDAFDSRSQSSADSILVEKNSVALSLILVIFLIAVT